MNMMVNRAEVTQSLVELGEALGSEVLMLPVFVFAFYEGSPPAYTNANGLYIREDVVRDEPHNVKIYVAHEIFHWVIQDHEKMNVFHPHIVNCADDYKINQYLKVLFGWDVHKVAVKGLRAVKYYKCSAFEIGKILSKKHKVPEVGCNCLGVAHPIIIEQARRIRRKFATLLGVQEHVFHIDMLDEKIFLAHVDKVRRDITLTIPTSLDFVLEGLWAHFFLEKPVAVQPKGKRLTNTQALALCFPAKRVRHTTVGKPSESIFAAALFLQQVQNDPIYLMNKVLEAKDRLDIIKKELEYRKTRPGKRKKFKKLKTLFLLERLINARQIFRNWKRKKPLVYLIKKYPVSYGKLLLHTTSATSLQQEIAKQETVIKLPRIKSNKTVKAIRTIATRALVELKGITEILQNLEETLGVDFDDVPDEKTAEEKAKEQEKQKGETQTDLDGEKSEGTGKNQGQGEGKPQKGKGEKGQRKNGKSSDSQGKDKDDSTAISVREKQKGKATGWPLPQQKIPNYDPSNEGTKKQQTTLGAGVGHGAITKLEVMTMVHHNIKKMENIIRYMDEFETKLKAKPSPKDNEDSDEPDSRFVYGNNLEKIVPEEFALLARKDSEISFYQKLANQSLMMRVPPDNRRYPVCIAIDGSGSMKGACYEKAAGFALAMIAKLKKDKRGVALMNFSSSITDVMVAGVDKEVNLAQALRVICSPAYGGTNFDAPLERAYEIKKQQNWKSMLTILVTDGQCDFYDKQTILQNKRGGDKITAIIVNPQTQVDNLRDVIDEIYGTSRDGMIESLVDAGSNIL